MSPITTHVLDIALGQPGRGVTVTIERLTERGEWSELARDATDADGRVAQFEMPCASLEAGTYRLRFETAAYFRSQGRPWLYPEIHLVIQIDDPARHYHVPVLLSPFGYSTYLGT
jgi:5-hydroxyisourate hydrolase